MHLHFLIPDTTSFQSGGNKYNNLIIESLKSEHQVDTSDFDPDTEQYPEGPWYIFDSLFVEHAAVTSQTLPAKSIGLIHHLNSMYPGEEGHFENCEKGALDQCYGFVASSAYTKSYLASKGYDADRIVVIEPATELDPVVDERSGSKIQALIVANAIPRKGMLPFLKALAAAQPQPFFTLNIVGSLDHDPVYAMQMQRVIREDASLSKCVNVLGKQDERTLLDLYAKSNLYLSTSYFETFGMAIQEALVYRIPTLVLPGGNCPNHIHEGVNGRVCQSLEDMAAAVVEMVEQPTQLEALIKSTMDYSPHYLRSWDAAAERLIAFLDAQ